MSDRRGWIKLWRQLAEHELWLGERFTRGQAFADLLMSAAHVEHQVIRGGRAITVPRGGVLTSQVALGARWRWNRETVVTYLRLLKKLDMISDISTVRGAGIGYTLLFIRNYDRYQSAPSDDPAFPPPFDAAANPAESPAFTQHSEEWKEQTTKKGKKGRAGARTPAPAFSSSNGRPSRKSVDADWGRPAWTEEDFR